MKNQSTETEIQKVLTMLEESDPANAICAFPKVTTNAKGKEKKTYPQENYMTPFEKFKSIENASKYLKIDCTTEELQRISDRISDNEMAEIVQKEKSLLFNN